MALFEHPEFDGHERIIHLTDAIRAQRIIAIHDRSPDRRSAAAGGSLSAKLTR